MIEFENLPYFEEFTDPNSGVKSYVLKQDQAKCTQSFYFTNQSMSADQKYLWMYCFFPPLRQRCLGVVSLDPANPFVRVFKEVGFYDATPLVSPEGDKVYFVDAGYGPGCSFSAMVCTVDVNGKVEKFAQMGQDYLGGRVVLRFGTHLTISADGKDMLIEGFAGAIGFVSLLDMHTRKFRIINEFSNHHDHGQFSPVDPELFLLDQDGWNDPYSGKHLVFQNRMWLCDRAGTRFEPVLRQSWFNHDGSHICHDFWSFDGHICWIDYQKGAYEMDPQTREVHHIWNHPLCHAHCNADRSFWVADQTPYEWDEHPCRVIFFNRETQKTVDIFSALPRPFCGRGSWHIDPHPQFTPDGAYVVSTTTVNDKVSISVTPTQQLIQKTL